MGRHQDAPADRRKPTVYNLVWDWSQTEEGGPPAVPALPPKPVAASDAAVRLRTGSANDQAHRYFKAR